jgi:hypothetical protein
VTVCSRIPLCLVNCGSSRFAGFASGKHCHESGSSPVHRSGSTSWHCDRIARANLLASVRLTPGASLWTWE